MYITVRQVPTPLSDRLTRLLPDDLIDKLIHQVSGLSLPGGLVHVLPDALWMFALCIAILLIWDFKLNRTTISWILAACSIGFLLEFFQWSQFMPGTFDWFDVLAISIAATLSLLFTIEYRQYEKAC